MRCICHDFKKRTLSEQIIITAARLEAFANKYIFEPHDITSPAIKIMGFLEKIGPCTATELMNRMGGSKSNITQRLNWLEKKKFIMRLNGKSTDDKRKRLVNITDSGRDKLKALTKELKREEFDLNKCFKNKEIGVIASTLIKINALLDKHCKAGKKDKIA